MFLLWPKDLEVYSCLDSMYSIFKKLFMVFLSSCRGLVLKTVFGYLLFDFNFFYFLPVLYFRKRKKFNKNMSLQTKTICFYFLFYFSNIT